jgi:tol-pal system protein YbgF
MLSSRYFCFTVGFFAFMLLMAGQALAQDASQAHIRLDRLENQIRQLTGHIERLTYEINQLKSATGVTGQAGQTTGQADQAGQNWQPSSGNPQPSSPGQTITRYSNDPYSPGYEQYQQNSASEAPSNTYDDVRPFDLSTLTRGPDALPVPDMGQAQAQGQPQGQGLNTGLQRSTSPVDPRDHYNTAYQYILQGDYQTAKDQFELFLADNPDHELEPQALFWLGESHYALGQYNDAAGAFLTVFNEHPGHAMVPEALTKLGLSLAALGQNSEACATYAKVLADYPQASRSVRELVVKGQTESGCS